MIFVYSPSNYRLCVLNRDTKHDSLHVLWHPSCEEVVPKCRSTSDVRIYEFDNQLNCAEKGARNMTCRRNLLIRMSVKKVTEQ